ncbi:hypothetical protein HPP92_004685 [Vanilla planifolia]|uniref:Uncharacterized protein n=1 Tax=Vanilla planifolia TaxID=51239 RepID=A0A835VA98_VANPL|nr:hypothetical protein HPP92_004685 [Vanilla planifolia]
MYGRNEPGFRINFNTQWAVDRFDGIIFPLSVDNADGKSADRHATRGGFPLARTNSSSSINGDRKRVSTQRQGHRSEAVSVPCSPLFLSACYSSSLFAGRRFGVVRLSCLASFFSDDYWWKFERAANGYKLGLYLMPLIFVSLKKFLFCCSASLGDSECLLFAEMPLGNVVASNLSLKQIGEEVVFMSYARFKRMVINNKDGWLATGTGVRTARGYSGGTAQSRRGLGLEFGIRQILAAVRERMRPAGEMAMLWAAAGSRMCERTPTESVAGASEICKGYRDACDVYRGGGRQGEIRAICLRPRRGWSDKHDLWDGSHLGGELCSQRARWGDLEVLYGMHGCGCKKHAKLCEGESMRGCLPHYSAYELHGSWRDCDWW